MLEIILLIIVMLTSIPAGMLLSRLCREELKELRKALFVLEIISVAGIFFLMFFWNNLIIMATLLYIGVLATVCILDSFKK